MSSTMARSHLHLLSLALSILAFTLINAVLAMGSPHSNAHSGEREADSTASRVAPQPGADSGRFHPNLADVPDNPGGVERTSLAEAGDRSAFPWKVSLLILVGGFVASVVAYVVTGRNSSRPPGKRVRR
jgi:hypothetical protein